MDEMSEQKITQMLLEAHASELMIIHTLSAHIAMTPRGDYRDGLEAHLRETRDHAERIQRHLAQRDQARGMVQVGYGIAQGMVGQVLAMTKFPMDLMRGMSGEEKLLKNARDECANEAMEIATYLAIEELANAAGDTSTARLAKSIRTDEEQMLERLLKVIPRLARDAYEAEVEGKPHFDLRRVGAVDAARSVAGTAARTVARSANRTGRKADRARTSGERVPSTGTRASTATSGIGATGSSSTSKSNAKSTAKSSSRAKSTKTTSARSKAGSKSTPRATTKSTRSGSSRTRTKAGA